MINWTHKLLALLHDPRLGSFRPPYQPRAMESLLKVFGYNSTTVGRDVPLDRDEWTSAADGILFPNASPVSPVNECRHPLAATRLETRAIAPSLAKAEQHMCDALNAVRVDAATLAANEKQTFLNVWRLLPEICARQYPDELTHLVADTRIPDHTVWHHNSLVSALLPAGSKPAFLLFQIGPVQDFIKQARKTQDLWAGSFLLSFLTGHAALAVAEEIGPDAIIYPSLRGVPLADWYGSKPNNTDWWPGEPRRASVDLDRWVACLPNRFLALIPSGYKNGAGKNLGQIASDAVRHKRSEIAISVHEGIGAALAGQFHDWDCFWNDQTARFPVIDWVVHDWCDAGLAFHQAKDLDTPPLHGGWEHHPLHYAQHWAQLNKATPNPGFVWALNYALTDWKFAATRASRLFRAWSDDSGDPRRAVGKDALDGRAEVIGGVNQDEFWTAMRKAFPIDFRSRQRLGAISVIKRLFPRFYLKDRETTQVRGQKVVWGAPGFVSTVHIAEGRFDKIAQAIDAEEEDLPEQRNLPQYYAILCMDGDGMGEWLSGIKTPMLEKVLAKETWANFRAGWPGGPAGKLPPAESIQRALTPYWHVALSEALSNFSLYCTRPIVKEFGGQVIYAGGEDVMAMVPATEALDCAQALQLALRGINPDRRSANASQRARSVLTQLFRFEDEDGWLTCKSGTASLDSPPNWRLTMLGPTATASVGIAIGHARAPMQDTIQAARDAEHAAKKVPGKAAFCLSILKRSGESVRFRAKWDGGAAAVWHELGTGKVRENPDASPVILSEQFAHRYLELLNPLFRRSSPVNSMDDAEAADGTQWEPRWITNPVDLRDAAEAELVHVLRRQTSPNLKPDAAQRIARSWMAAIIGDRDKPQMPPADFFHFWAARAFVNRLQDS